MKKASVRDLRYDFPRIEEMLRDGEEIQITKRKKVIARLVPDRVAGKPVAQRDFLARLRGIYGEKALKVSGADLLAQERGRY